MGEAANPPGIDFASHTPFYLQLHDLLRERIAAGVWRPGDQLPGEHALCATYGLSRSVVRQALGELEHEGLIVRRRGKGAFVVEPKIVESLAQKLTGFHQDMREQGRRPISRVLAQAVIPSPAGIAHQLGLPTGAPVVHLRRLRFVDGEPIVLVSSYLPAAACPGLESVDFRERSLYAYLHAAYGLLIARGWRTIEAVVADERTAELLEVPPGAPLLQLDSIGYLENGVPLEYYRALHRGDRSQFEVELVRISGAGAQRRTLGSTTENLPPSNKLIERVRQRSKQHARARSTIESGE
jgi:GntR family transcriptional regulator